jgi:hypothetical protein
MADDGRRWQTLADDGHAVDWLFMEALSTKDKLQDANPEARALEDDHNKSIEGIM